MDRGIDGIRWVRTGPREGEFDKVLVSVKGGENVGAAMVRDLKGTIEREGALGRVVRDAGGADARDGARGGGGGVFRDQFRAAPKDFRF